MYYKKQILNSWHFAWCYKYSNETSCIVVISDWQVSPLIKKIFFYPTSLTSTRLNLICVKQRKKIVLPRGKICRLVEKLQLLQASGKEIINTPQILRAITNRIYNNNNKKNLIKSKFIITLPMNSNKARNMIITAISK